MTHTEELMDRLFELNERLSHAGGNPAAMNLLEAYSNFWRTSTAGRECGYATKCLSLFIQKDYEYIREKIEEIHDLIIQIEAENG